ncbi:MAG: aldo/keto reductase [Pseudolysinimonas sp.]
MTDIAFRPLGDPSLLVSTVGLGCNNFGRPGSATQGQEGTTAVIDEAIELGVTLLDTADIYGSSPGQSETLMGAALKGRRDRVILATKFGHAEFDTGLLPGAPKGSRAYIRASIDGSLRRLQVEHVDLYQLHTPDPATPIEETLGALDELVREGKVRHIGSTQFSAEQLGEADAAAHANGTARFISSQNEYSLLSRAAEADVLPAARELGLGFLPFFPLHNGLLTGKFTRSDRPADSRIARQRPHVADDAPWDVMERYATWCTAAGVTMLQATFAWLLAQPGLTSVIAGVTRPDQLTANVAAGAVALSPEQVAEISAIFA